MLDRGQQISVYKIDEILTYHTTHICCLTEDPFFHSTVLLKVYPVEFLTDDQQRNSFEKALEKHLPLEHPSIAPVFDSGVEGEYFYYTTNYNHEVSLTDQAKAGMSSEKILKVVRDLSCALEYAVEQGAGCGDLSSDDIYFNDDNLALIADFGIEYSIECFRENKDLQCSVAQLLEQLGGLQLQLLRPSKQDYSGRELELIAGIENKDIQRLTERYFTKNEDSYQSFTELIDAIDSILEEPPVETRPVVQNKSLDVCSNTGISGQQRDQVLPHVRQLISEKNHYKTLLDEALLNQHKTQDQLEQALVKVDQVNQLQLSAPKNITVIPPQRKKIAGWVFVGFVFGIILSGGFGYSLQEKKSKDIIPLSVVEKPLLEAQPLAVEVETKEQVIEEPVVLVKETIPDQQPMAEVDVQKREDITLLVEQEQPWLPAGEEFSTGAIPLSEAVAMESPIEQSSSTGVFSTIEREVLLSNLSDWSQSWSEQNPEVYFSHYSEQYRPEQGGSRQDWLKSRRSRLQRPAWIKVQLDDVKIRQLASNRVQIKFKQDYRSDYYQDQIMKSLNLIKENGMWKILTERSLGRVDIVATR